MKCLWIVVGLGFICLLAQPLPAEAKKKRKFEGDFEFADEEESRVLSGGTSGEKKRWIHDPNSDLCRPLNCKKKELCLLEDEFTAVCVSKKDLHKSGDIVVPKAKVQEEPKVDDVFYDNEDDSEDEESDTSQDVAALECYPCPVVKPTFLCGTDNRTYSSLCRLDYHNCLHHTNIKVLCKGFCPCKDVDVHMRKKQKQAEMVSSFMSKYKSTVGAPEKPKPEKPQSVADKYTFTPQDFKYENKHYKYIKYTKHDNKISKSQQDVYSVTNPPYYEDKERQRGDNEVFESKPTLAAGKDCSPAALQAMGDRLLDWFSVVMADAKRRRTHTKSKGRYPVSCKNEVRWMFQHLDIDADSKLSLQELYDLEHDQNEQCIKPFLDACDTDRDIFVSPHEWCDCFDKTDRPCAAVKRRITSNLGVYMPDCDTEGYYQPTQCHSAVGMCWCVDKHGVEVPNSRTRGKPNCEALVGKSKSNAKVPPVDDLNNDDDDDDDDDDDSDQDLEGSADQPLDF